MAEMKGKTLVMLVFEVTDGPLGQGETARKQYAEELVNAIARNREESPELITAIQVPARSIWHASVIDMSFERGKKCSMESGEFSPEERTTEV